MIYIFYKIEVTSNKFLYSIKNNLNTIYNNYDAYDYEMKHDRYGYFRSYSRLDII